MSIAMPRKDEIMALTKKLSLPHLRREFEQLITTATTQQWAPADVLAACLACEEQGRQQMGLKRRLQALGADSSKTFDTFDEQLSTVDPATLGYLKSLTWIDNKENLVVAGPSGTGKTHLCQALAQAVVVSGGKARWLSMQEIDQLVGAHRVDFTVAKEVKKLVSVDLLVIDDLGLLPVNGNAA